jgi:hypothetical protein
MAIAYNAASSTSNGGVTSLNVNHSAAGTNRYALIAVYSEGGDFASHNIASIAYAGGGGSVGLIARSGEYGELSLYQVIAPATGSQAVTVNFTNTSPRCALAVISYTGVLQVSPRRDTDSTFIDNSGTSVSLTLDSATGDLVLDVCAQGGTSQAANVSQTERISLDNFSSTARSMGMSEKAAAGAFTTMQWSSGGVTTHWHIAVAIQPSEASSVVEATVTPGVGSIRMSASPPNTNPFTNVRISEILINEAGSPLSGRTGMHLLVWYEGYPFGAPDLSYSNATTGAAGTLSYSLASGPLAYNDPIFYVLTDGNASGSLSGYTCARMVPTYSG